MKLLISLSAPFFEVNQRVAVEFDKNDWSIGTILKATPTGYRIAFDFGETQLIKIALARIVAVERKARLKKALTFAQVKELKPSVKKTAAKALPKKIVLIKEEPKAVPIVAERPKAPEHQQKDTSEEITLEHFVGNPSLFAKCTSGTSAQIKTNQRMFMQFVWTRANDKLFDNKLTMPNLGLMREMKNFRGLGYWREGKRELKITPRLFNATHAHIITTLVHEMCHQAVSEIDNVVDRTAGGHGPNWTAWMHKCGLDPHRYNKDDRTTFMSDSERLEAQRILTNRKNALENVEHRKLSYPRALMPAQYHDAKNNVWVKGLIVRKHDQAGKRWCFISSPTSSSWKVIPPDWFYEISEEEKPMYLAPEFIQAAQEIDKYKQYKLHQLRTRKSDRYTDY